MLVVLWFRTGWHDPDHRPASVPYSTAYAMSAAFFAASVAVEARAQYWMWAVGLVCEVVGMVVALQRWTPPASQGGDTTIAATPSLIERLGLFVIIVLGEVVVGGVNGMADVRDAGADAIVPGLLGVLVAIGLWWLYFDLVSHRRPVSRWTQPWLYVHLPMVMAMAAVGAGVLNTVEHAHEPTPDAVRWLLVGALAVAMVSIMALTVLLEVRAERPEIYRRVDIVLVVSAVWRSPSDSPTGARRLPSRPSQPCCSHQSQSDLRYGSSSPTKRSPRLSPADAERTSVRPGEAQALNSAHLCRRDGPLVPVPSGLYGELMPCGRMSDEEGTWSNSCSG